MSILINFQIKQLPALRIVGKAIHPLMDMKVNPIPDFWSQCFGDGTFKTLENLPVKPVDDSYVGFMSGWDAGNGTFAYICGMLLPAGSPVPEGFTCMDLPAANVAVGWIQGPEKENYQVAHELTQQAMEKQGHKMILIDPWCMELYNCPRFTQPQPNGDVILDYYIPCQPAADTL